MIKTLVVTNLAAFIIAVSLSACGGNGGNDDPDRLTLATSDQPIGSLVYIAQERGYFQDAGLDVTFQRHASGKNALDSVIEGTADIATVAETPVMHAALEGVRTLTMATIGASDRNLVIIGRRDKGISVNSDLRGKRIGATAGTNGEFFLDTFLVVHGISDDEVETVNLAPGDMFDALTTGQVDAVSAWQPHVSRLQEELGDNGVSFYGEGIYTWTWNLVSMPEFAQDHPGEIERVVQALVKAESYAREDPAAARTIVAEATGVNETTLDELWPAYDFAVTLQQSLLITLEDQSRWAMDKHLTDNTIMPNYLEYVYLDALEEARPDAVTIIR